MPLLPLFDTNVYGSHEYEHLLDIARQRKHLVSMVVVQKLLVIADGEEVQWYRELMNEAREKEMLFTPDEQDWFEVGRCLQRLHHGEIVDLGSLDQNRLNNLVKDALIARCAMKSSGVVVTENTPDFELLKRVLRSLRFVSPSEFFGTRPR